MEARQAGPRRRGPGVRHPGDRRDRVPVPARQEPARPRRVDHRRGNPSRREAGDPSHHRAGPGRAERPAARRQRRRQSRGLRARHVADRVSGGHRRAVPEGRGLRLPDALHAERPGSDRPQQDRLLLPRGRQSAEVSAAPDGADGFPFRDSARRQGVRHDHDARDHARHAGLQLHAALAPARQDRKDEHHLSRRQGRESC